MHKARHVTALEGSDDPDFLFRWRCQDQGKISSVMSSTHQRPDGHAGHDIPPLTGWVGGLKTQLLAALESPVTSAGETKFKHKRIQAKPMINDMLKLLHV